MGERLIDGRDLTPADTLGAENVALVNDAMARKYWAGRQAVGGRFKMGGPKAPWITVVGVVGNVTHNGVTTIIKPKFYRPVRQFSQSFADGGSPSRNTTLIMRTTGDPMALARPVRDRIRQIDAELPVAAIRTLDNVVATSIATPRLTGQVLVLFAGLALLLAGIGIYGLMAYSVEQRRQEIGIRLALGAQATQVKSMVVFQGMRLAAVGVIIGVAGAFALSRLLTAFLYGVTSRDPVVFAGVPVILTAVAFLAVWLPARRASSVDPTIALRYE
jgi:predicted permease